MKKTALALVMMLAFAFNGMAQDRGRSDLTPEQKAEKMTERMAEHLQLSDDQKTAVYDLNLKMINVAREDRKEYHKQHDAALKEILSEEQYQKLVDSRKERREQRGHPRN